MTSLKKITLRALRSITASQSPTGKAIARGDEYAVIGEARAREHERAGLAERVRSKSAK